MSRYFLSKFPSFADDRCAFVRSELGNIMNNVNAAMLLIVFFSCGVFYVTIWIKVRRSAKEIPSVIDSMQKERKKKINR